jgi:signal transduction histidine kinase
VRLTEDLRRSREQVITAREEERRRLRRDLHDGLGPRLASLTLRLETARDRLTRDVEAEKLLAELAERSREAVADIRRLVYALRPPALDELGLVSALRETAAQYSYGGSATVQITLKAPEVLPPLPAAVEVAAFRMVQEALTNVVRHAQASHCSIQLAFDPTAQELRVEVRDDGRGFQPGGRVGVGLASMRERAEELGGTWDVQPLPGGGTCVRARLPCRLPGTDGVVSREPAGARGSGV